MMNIRSRRQDHRAIVSVFGDVDMDSVERFERVLLEQVEGDAILLVLDAARMGYIYSNGLAVLVRVLSRLRRQGRSFWILNPSKQMRPNCAIAPPNQGPSIASTPNTTMIFGTNVSDCS